MPEQVAIRRDYLNHYQLITISVVYGELEPFFRGGGGGQHFLSKINYQYLTRIIIVSSGNYQDSLSDARAATTLQPTYLKAIVRGEKT